jgi:hypothetical protein
LHIGVLTTTEEAQTNRWRKWQSITEVIDPRAAAVSLPATFGSLIQSMIMLKRGSMTKPDLKISFSESHEGSFIRVDGYGTLSKGNNSNGTSRYHWDGRPSGDGELFRAFNCNDHDELWQALSASVPSTT